MRAGSGSATGGMMSVTSSASSGGATGSACLRPLVGLGAAAWPPVMSSTMGEDFDRRPGSGRAVGGWAGRRADGASWRGAAGDAARGSVARDGVAGAAVRGSVAPGAVAGGAMRGSADRGGVAGDAARGSAERGGVVGMRRGGRPSAVGWWGMRRGGRLTAEGSRVKRRGGRPSGVGWPLMWRADRRRGVGGARIGCARGRAGCGGPGLGGVAGLAAGGAGGVRVGAAAPGDPLAVDLLDEVLNGQRGALVGGVEVPGPPRRARSLTIGRLRRGIALPRGATSGPLGMPVPIVTHQRTSLYFFAVARAELDRHDTIAPMITIPPR
ncbi:hypothetical protein CRM89_25025 [Nocardia sp. FDAARGOS_372]|nr:hypothetical protein CRM89_25025 [Nocardia sp. FDAARGOS_372]